MPIDRCSRAAASALCLSLLLALLAGCSLLPGDEPEAPGERPVAAPADVVEQVRRVLARRAAAVRRGDRDRFLATVVRRRALRVAESTYFANLAQLPLAEFRYAFDPASLVREGDDYWVLVDLHLQLDGYDATPVVTRDRMRLRTVPGGRLRIAATADRAWERRNGVHPAPWEAGPVEVRTGAGVLGIFDAGSVRHAESLVASVQRGIDQVSAVVPYEWSRTVVVYALSDPSFLAHVPALPGGDPDPVAAVAFPVPAGPGDPTIASTRVVFHPRTVAMPGPERDRLVRHELAHVAIGERDDRAPVWLSEGIAEYVSVRPMAPQDRRVAAAAVEAARADRVVLPADRSFNGADSAQHYGLSWWACEYLARSFGETVLFGLLDAAAAGEDVPEVMQRRLALGERELARRGADLLLATYGG